MSDADEHRRKADELLRTATRTTDLQARNRLIAEAAALHKTAQDLEAGIAPEEAPAPPRDEASNGS
jgi:hypothetical protein